MLSTFFPALSVVFFETVASVLLSRFFCALVCVLVTQAGPTLCNARDCSLPGSSAHGIFQARILEWVTIPSSRGSSWPRNRTGASCIGRQAFYHRATWGVFVTTLPRPQRTGPREQCSQPPHSVSSSRQCRKAATFSAIIWGRARGTGAQPCHQAWAPSRDPWDTGKPDYAMRIPWRAAFSSKKISDSWTTQE